MLNIYRQQNQEMDEPKQAQVTAPPKPAVHADFKKYVDPTGELNSSDLGYGMWYVGHRLLIYRLILITLISISVVLWGYSLVRWGIFFLDWNKDTLVAKQLATAPNYTLFGKRFAPTQLQVLSTSLLPGGVDKYDAVADVANTDENFMAEIEYYFIIGGTATSKRTTVLLPGENRPVAELGLGGIDSAMDVTFKISNIWWQRIDAHEVPRPLEWQTDRLDFTVASTTYSPSQNFGEGLKVNTIAFELTNNSAYGYIQPNFYVGLYEGESLVGVMPLTLPQFASLQTVPVDLRNFVGGLNVSTIKVFPLINLYDHSVYLAPTR